jgi:uncharacterized protein GlcG (DUF336 family)
MTRQSHHCRALRKAPKVECAPSRDLPDRRTSTGPSGPEEELAVHQVYRITLDDALPMLAAARAKAEEIGVKQTICVCDDGGHVLALHRLPGARLTGVEIAMAKAFTAAGHERATHKFNEPPNGPALPGNEAFGIAHMYPGKFAIFVGGFPIEYEGQIVGAVGVSGGNGEQDKAVGAAALQAFADSVARVSTPA